MSRASYLDGALGEAASTSFSGVIASCCDASASASYASSSPGATSSLSINVGGCDGAAVVGRSWTEAVPRLQIRCPRCPIEAIKVQLLFLFMEAGEEG